MKMTSWMKDLCSQLYDLRVPLELVANSAETSAQMSFVYAYTMYVLGKRVRLLREMFQESREEMAKKILSTAARVKRIEDAECDDLPMREIICIAMAYYIKTADLLDMKPFEWYFDIDWSFGR